MLALIGLRCSGKTSLGRALARRLGASFLDLDDVLLDLARDEGLACGGDSAGALLAAVGEPRFRDLEARALERVLTPKQPCVLATGGGVVEREANRALLAQRALCVWLHADLDTLRERLRADPALRPALAGGDAADELADLARRRGPWYAALARLELDTTLGDPPALVESIAQALDPAARPLFALRRG